jgi:hypothetical protein
MFDLMIWILGLVAVLAVIALLGLLSAYCLYLLLHQNDYGHIEHLDSGDDTGLQPLLGVVAPKNLEDSYGPILTSTKRK